MNVMDNNYHSQTTVTSASIVFGGGLGNGPRNKKQEETATTTIGSAAGVALGLKRGGGQGRGKDEAEEAGAVVGAKEQQESSSLTNAIDGTRTVCMEARKTAKMTSSSFEPVTITTPSSLKNTACGVKAVPQHTRSDDSSTASTTFQDQILHHHRHHLPLNGNAKNDAPNDTEEEEGTCHEMRNSDIVTRYVARDEKVSNNVPMAPHEESGLLLQDGSASESEGRSRRTSLSSMALDSSLGDEIADALAVAATEATINAKDQIANYRESESTCHDDDDASMELLPFLEEMEIAVTKACQGKVETVQTVKACLAAFAVVLSDFAVPVSSSAKSCGEDNNNDEHAAPDSNEPPEEEYPKGKEKEEVSPTATTVLRPPIPLTVAKRLWHHILRRKAPLDAASLNPGEQDTAEAAADAVDHQLAMTEEILLHNLGFLNVAENPTVKKEEETKFPINVPTFTDILARQMDDDSESLNLDSVLSTKQGEYSKETGKENTAVECPEVYVRINDDNVLYFGRYLAQEFPELFRPRTKEDSTIDDSAQWNAGPELNGIMVHVALQVLEDALSAENASANKSSTPLLRYLLEMLPLHMMRCRQYGEVAKMIGRRDFVELRLRTVGLLDGTAMCVVDAEELKIRITQEKSERSSAILTRSYGAVMHYIRRATKKTKRGTTETIEAPSPPLPPISSIEAAQALRSMAESLSKHGLRGDAMNYNSRAVVHYERARSTAAMSSAAFEGNHSEPSLDEIQLIMAEILNEMALVHDGRGHHTDAMLCFERALSFYSQRQTKSHSKGVASTLRLMGMHHFQLQEFDLALACFDDIVSLLRPEPSKADEVGDIIQWAGNTLRESGRYNDALAKFAEALGLKMLLHGSGHPDIARIHHSMGCVNDDLSKFSASLSHYNEALLIWRSLLRESKEAEPQSKEMRDQEVQIVETLKCIGNVHGIHCHHVSAYRCYQECSEICRSRVSASVSSIAASTIKTYLEEDPDAAAQVERWHECLLLALQMARSALLNGGGVESHGSDKDEVEDGLADVLYDLGVIHSANSALGVGGNKGDRHGDHDDDASEKEKAERHLLECASLRQRQQDLLYMKCAEVGGDPRDMSMLLSSQAKAAFALYELGNLYCPPLLRICQFSSSSSHIRRFRRAVGATSAQSCVRAINFLQEARGMIRKAMDTPEFPPPKGKEVHVAVQRLPSKYEAVMEKLGRLHRALGQFDEAEESYQEMVTILGHSTLAVVDHDDEVDDHDDEVDGGSSRKLKKLKFLQNIGDTLLEKGQVEFAEKKYLEALDLSREIDEDGIATAALLYPIGEIHLEAKRWEEASRCVGKAMHILRAHLGEGHSDVALCLNRLGRASEGRKQVPEAFSYYRDAMELVKDKVDDQDADLSVADVFFDFGRMVVLHEKKAKVGGQQEQEGGSSMEPQITDDLFAFAHHGAKMACARYKLELGDKSRDTADACSLAGEFSEKSGEYEVAVSYFADALRVYRRLRGARADNDAKVARTLEKIGLLHFNHGNDRDKALKCFDLGIRLLKQKNRTKTEDYAELFFSKGSVYFENDEASDAFVCYKEALTTYEELLGRGHVKIAVVLERIGWCLVKSREHKNAMLYFEEALHVRNLHQEDGDVDNADILFGMGIIHCENGSYQDAIDAYEEALRIWRATFGDSHLKVAHVLNNVGSVIARQKDYEQAIHHWERAVEIYKLSGLTNDHPTVACTMGNIEISKRFVTIAQSRSGGGGAHMATHQPMMNNYNPMEPLSSPSHEGSRESITKMWSSLL